MKKRKIFDEMDKYRLKSEKLSIIARDKNIDYEKSVYLMNEQEKAYKKYRFYKALLNIGENKNENKDI